MARIIYFSPDFPQPSGGIKTLYRHVTRLVEMGFDAWIVHQKHPFRVTWHGFEAPTLWLSECPRFTPEDVLVIPEVMHQVMQGCVWEEALLELQNLGLKGRCPVLHATTSAA